MRRIGRYRSQRERVDVCDFEVIGELRSDATHLLLRGCDGHFYAMDPTSGQLAQLEPDDSWALDAVRDAPRRIAEAQHVVA